MKEFQLRLSKDWDRTQAIINPSFKEIEDVLNNPDVGQACLGQVVAVGCYLKNNTPTFKGATNLSLYLGHEGSVVVSRDFDSFLVCDRNGESRIPLPTEGGEESLISACFFVPVVVAVDLIWELSSTREIPEKYEWDDPKIYENLIRSCE